MNRAAQSGSLLLATLLACWSGTALAADRIYQNGTEGPLVIWLRPVTQQRADWEKSEVLEPNDTYKTKLTYNQYDFRLYFPDLKETRNLGRKSVQSQKPLTFVITERHRVDTRVQRDANGNILYSAPMETYYTLDQKKGK